MKLIDRRFFWRKPRKEKQVDPQKEPTEDMLQDIVDRNHRLSNMNNVLVKRVGTWRRRAMVFIGVTIAIVALRLIEYGSNMAYKLGAGEVAEVQGVDLRDGALRGGVDR